MSQHPTESKSASALPAPTILKWEPNALLQVKLVKAEKESAPLNPWLLGLMVAAIVIGFVVLILWGTYVYPRTYPPPIDVLPLSISLVQPAYVAIGDEAGLDVTVKNLSTDPITGTVAVVLEGSAAAYPSPLEKTFISLDGLAGGASLTRRIKFSICQAPTFCCRDVISVALQVTVGDQCARYPVGAHITVAPLPYINASIALLSSSAVTTAVVTFLSGEIKKRLFGTEGK